MQLHVNCVTDIFFLSGVKLKYCYTIVTFPCNILHYVNGMSVEMIQRFVFEVICSGIYLDVK